MTWCALSDGRRSVTLHGWPWGGFKVAGAGEGARRRGARKAGLVARKCCVPAVWGIAQ